MSHNLYNFVIDCSLAMTWCFEDESSEFSDTVLESLKNMTALVPTIWPLEVANVLVFAKKHGRITEVQSASFIDALLALPIIIDESSTSRALHSVFTLATQVDLSIYDASYLELAMREKIPLLTLDKCLIKAAKKMDIPLQI